MMAVVFLAGGLAATFMFGFWVGYELARAELDDELERRRRRRSERRRRPGD